MTLAVSLLPTVVWRELIGITPAWLPAARITFVVMCLAASVIWPGLRSLRAYLIIILALESAGWLTGWLSASALWHSVFPSGASFVVSMLGTQLLRLMVTLGMVLVLLALRYRRQDFFLTRGQVAATAAPIPLLMSQPTSWRRLGLMLSVCITLGTLAFLVITGHPSLALFAYALPLLPAVLLFAALNAFNEEVTYRASFLASLEPALGGRHALLLTSVYFGLSHYYGVPYGMIGVLMAGVLGWLLGKSMLETRGLAWAWFIHLWQDAAIFLFMALGSVVPGGA
jgi:hypothetical protein